MYLETWHQNKEECAAELKRRLMEAQAARKPLEDLWRICEDAVYRTGSGSVGLQDGVLVDQVSEGPDGMPDGAELSVHTNYVMRDVRFVCSQLSSNPPIVVPRPSTSDVDDRRKADCADQLARFGLRHYLMQERFDQHILNSVVHGTGILKSFFNPNKGDIIDFDEENKKIVMEGDFDIKVISPWRFLPEPAECWEDVRYVFEEIDVPYEEACSIAPDFNHDKFIATGSENLDAKRLSPQQRREKTVKLYQYWEKGLPYNGFRGRFCWLLASGEPITDMVGSGHSFAKYKKDPVSKEYIKGKIDLARLPYHITTDLDVPGTYWGMSFVAYSATIQRTINNIDNMNLDNIKVHGAHQLILGNGASVPDDVIGDSPVRIIQVDGPPGSFALTPALPFPAAANDFRQKMQNDLMEVDGVNEASFGKMSRETSGFSMQYASSQSTALRRRLFNKYVLTVECVYNDFFDIARKHWTTPRQIQVLGKEKAFLTKDFQASNIYGGFDLVSEYGTSFSLDPQMRRQELLQMQPVFEKAGMPPRQFLSLLKLNEITRGFDMMELAESRQREIFDIMLEKKTFIEPEELQDHENMLIYAYTYVMTAEFRDLPKESKDLIRQHIKAREQIAAKPAAEAPLPTDALPPPESEAPPPADLMAALAGGG